MLAESGRSSVFTIPMSAGSYSASGAGSQATASPAPSTTIPSGWSNVRARSLACFASSSKTTRSPKETWGLPSMRAASWNASIACSARFGGGLANLPLNGSRPFCDSWKAQPLRQPPRRVRSVLTASCRRKSLATTLSAGAGFRESVRADRLDRREQPAPLQVPQAAAGERSSTAVNDCVALQSNIRGEVIRS